MEGLKGPCPARCCERQFFDSSRVACCYFSSTDASVSEAGDRSVSGQGILIQLSDSTGDSQLEQQLVVLTSHQLVPSLSSARGWVIGFSGSKKEFSLNDYVDQKQLRVITCCGPDGLWDIRKGHPVNSCPMRGGCSVLLLGTDLTREVLAEIGTSMEMFTTDHIMHLEAAQKVLLGGPAVIVCHRNKTTVLPSSFQISKPPAVDFSLLSSHMDWYHKHYTMFDYLLDSAPLYYTGAPIIYCEPNTGKPWLLGMHVYLESQSVQYGVSVGHIFELLQCSLFLSSCGAPHYSYIPKLSLLDQAVQKNICAPRYYDNISDNLVCVSLELTELLQISHCVSNKQLLFAQSETFPDNLKIRRSSLLLLEALSKSFKNFDADHVAVTVDGVKEWCPTLTAEDIHKDFSQLCQQLAYCILQDEEREDMVQIWFSCWSNLICLNSLVMNPIFQYELFLTFQKCKALYPGNTCVQKCFGEIMDVCFITQFRKTAIVEAKQAKTYQKCEELCQSVSELQEKSKQQDNENQAQQESHSPEHEQSRDVLIQVISDLQSRLKESESNLQAMQKFLRERISIQATPQWDKKQGFSLELDFNESQIRNGDQNDLSYAETDGPTHNIRRTSQQLRSCRRVSSVPTTSTPNRPPSLQAQRRSCSDVRYRSNTSSSSYPSSTASMESFSIEEKQYQEQQSITSTASSEYGTPACTPESMSKTLGLNLQAREKEIEDIYKCVVQENFKDFAKLTDFPSISPLLVEKHLISHDECSSIDSRPTEKSKHYYTQILPTKGPGAYSLLRRCIQQETEHRGHAYLNDLFVTEERRIGIISQDVED